MNLKCPLTQVNGYGRKSHFAHADGKARYSDKSYYSVCTNTLRKPEAKINLVQLKRLEEVNEKTLHNMNSVT